MPRYEFTQGTSKKFWDIALSGASFTITYGRIGSEGRPLTKSWKTPAECKGEYEKLIAEKERKGYVLVSGKSAKGKPGKPAKSAAPAKATAPRTASPKRPVDEKAVNRKAFYTAWEAGKRESDPAAAQRHYDQALAVFDAKAFSDPTKNLTDDANSAQCALWSDIAANHSARGDNKRAIVAIDQSLKFKRGYDPTPFYNRGVILIALGRHEDAVQSIDKALREVRSLHASPPNNVGDYFAAKAEALEAMGEIDAAIANYEHALPLGKGRLQHADAKAKLKTYQDHPRKKNVGKRGSSPWKS